MTPSTQSSPASLRREGIFTIGLIIVGLVLILGFGMQTVVSYRHIQQTKLAPGITDVETIRGWMTIPDIATAHRVPEAYLFEQLRIPPESDRTKSLDQLFFGKQAAILKTVKEAIRRYHAEHPTATEAGASEVSLIDFFLTKYSNYFTSDFIGLLVGGVVFGAGIYPRRRRRRQR